MPRVNLIQIRKGTDAAWTSANPVLAAGEPGYVTDTNEIVIGDGVTAYTGLTSISGGGSVLFLGLYTSLANLEAAHATADSGQYAIVDPGSGTDAVKYIWDEEEGWVAGGGSGASVWGDLGGDITNQTDLVTELNSRLKALLVSDPQPGNYQLGATDLLAFQQGENRIVTGDDSGDLTVPPNATTAFPIGYTIPIEGYDNVVQGAGVTVNGTNGGLTISTGTIATLRKTGTNTWTLYNGTASEAASETEAGIVELATTAETTTGTDNTRAVTPAGLTGKLSSKDSKTTSFSTVQTQNQKLVFLNAITTQDITIDQLTIDTYISLVNIGSGQWNLVEGTGVTLHGASTFVPGGEVNSVTLWWGSATDVYVISGYSTSLNSLSVNGVLAVRAGLSAGIIGKVGGIIYKSITTAGNVGTGEDDLFNYEVPANTLAVDKSSLYAIASGTFAANANNKRIRARFGTTQIFDSTALAINSGDWKLEIEIFRTGAATQKTVCTLRTSSATLVSTVDYTTSAVDLSTPLALQVTAEATSNNDIVGEFFKVVYEPAE